MCAYIEYHMLDSLKRFERIKYVSRLQLTTALNTETKKATPRDAPTKSVESNWCASTLSTLFKIFELFSPFQKYIYVLRNRFFVVYKQKAHVKLRNR